MSPRPRLRVGCAGVAAWCLALPRSAHPICKNTRKSAVFSSLEATLNLRVEGSIPSRLTSLRSRSQAKAARRSRREATRRRAESFRRRETPAGQPACSAAAFARTLALEKPATFCFLATRGNYKAHKAIFTKSVSDEHRADGPDLGFRAACPVQSASSTSSRASRRVRGTTLG